MDTLNYEVLAKSGYNGYILKNAPEKVLQFGEGVVIVAVAVNAGYYGRAAVAAEGSQRLGCLPWNASGVHGRARYEHVMLSVNHYFGRRSAACYVVFDYVSAHHSGYLPQDFARRECRAEVNQVNVSYVHNVLNVVRYAKIVKG